MMKRRDSERFAYIETCLYWSGGVTAPQLAEAFGIDRRNAQTVIAQYREKYPQQLIYNESAKRHEPSESFQPYFIKTDPHLYLDYLRGSYLVGKFIDYSTWTDLSVVNVDDSFRTAIDNKMVKSIINAVQLKQALIIEYHAKAKWHYLTISPHRLVYASRRYHVRAYVHEWNNYIDVVLSRIYSVKPTEQFWVSDDGDEKWQTFIELKFQPNPALPEQFINTLKVDYYDFSMDKSLLDKGLLIIKTRKALEGYILREMERADWRYKMPLWIIKENH